jgi:hypothetical protein
MDWKIAKRIIFIVQRGCNKNRRPETTPTAKNPEAGAGAGRAELSSLTEDAGNGSFLNRFF